MKQLSMYEETYESLYENSHLDSLEQPQAPQKNEFSSQKTALVTLNTNESFKVEQKPKVDVQEANVTEIILTKDKADCIQLLLPMLTHLNQDQRWLAWVDPPIQLLKQWGQEHDTSATEDIMILRSIDTYSAF